MPTQMSDLLLVHLAEGIAFSMYLRCRLTNPATIQAQIDGFELTRPNTRPDQ